MLDDENAAKIKTYITSNKFLTKEINDKVIFCSLSIYLFDFFVLLNVNKDTKLCKGILI